ncbi:YcbK family protein [Chelativorans sp.]|uniref:YcbK family protein n=1 Tax=Chelativorans sp. TaxID=2203393 RepID=UPI00281276BE|nr:YcbK family protein [Chelativorans sp.]
MNLDPAATEPADAKPSTRPTAGEDRQAEEAQPKPDAASGNQVASAEAAAAEPKEEPAAQAESAPSQRQKRGFLAGLFAAGPQHSSPPAEQSTASAPDPEVAAAPAQQQEPAEAAAQSAAPAERIQAAAQAAETEDAPAAAEPAPAAAETLPQKRSFLSAFFAPSERRVPFPDEKAKPAEAAQAAEAAKAAAEAARSKAEKAEKPVIAVASAETAPVQAAAFSGDALPGVRAGEQLFEVRLGNLTDEGDVDVYEQEAGYVEIASAAGLARLAPNGLLKQRESVDVSCFKPRLVHVLKTIERRFGKRVVVTSGYRSPAYNRRVRGAPRSQHMNCAAADIVVEGVSKWELARFARSLPGRGGVGTYCHTNAVHVDVGPERDWNWRCGRRG